ncbi:MAG TPA: rhodanese-like domain-containing protein, partial [Candidatus Hydrogenedentes bacterium]|nr:rhodanese-like domain-containing protein [Candidatus Hydrogenedentota bacterium]
NASPESPAAPAEAAVEPAEITGLLIAPEVLVLHQDVVPVDVRPAEAYAAGHLPGAVSLPAAALSEERGGVQNLLKPVDQLAAILAERGMTTERRYVIYGGNTSATEVQAATRVFWVLEYLSFPSVYLLDGGYARWTAEGRPVAQGPYTPSPIPVESVKLVIRPEVIARRSEVIDMVGNGKGVLVDTRMPSFYAGAEKKDFVARAGHIPGAVNLPADPMLTGPDFRFRAMEEIRAGFTTGSDDPLERIVVYCNSGNTASLGYFLFRLQGKENVAVYDGSMAEWARNPALNVVTEPVPEAAPAQPESGAAPAGEAVSAPQPEPSQPADAVQPTPSDATPDSSAPAVPPAETGGADAQPPAAPPAESGQPAPEGASAEQPSQEPAPVESAPAPEQTSQPAEAEPAPPSADAQQPNPAPPDPQSQQ